MRMRLSTILIVLLVGGCASRDTGREVAAVVQDEGARGAAATAARQGEDSRDAVKAGAEAAAKDRDPSEPPI
jgi:hypothetical protein